MTRRPSRKRRSIGGAASFRLAMTGGLCGSMWGWGGRVQGSEAGVKRRGAFYSSRGHAPASSSALCRGTKSGAGEKVLWQGTRVNATKHIVSFSSLRWW